MCLLLSVKLVHLEKLTSFIRMDLPCWVTLEPTVLLFLPFFDFHHFLRKPSSPKSDESVRVKVSSNVGVYNAAAGSFDFSCVLLAIVVLTSAFPSHDACLPSACRAAAAAVQPVIRPACSR